MTATPKNRICLWYNGTAELAGTRRKGCSPSLTVSQGAPVRMS